MATVTCNFRLLVLVAVAMAVEAETCCTSQMQKLIDKKSMQQSHILELEEDKKRQDEEYGQRVLVEDLEFKGLQRRMDKIQTQVATVVIMACDRADYLKRTIKSILKYQNAVASEYPLFVSPIDGSDPQVRQRALSYDQLTYMQHLYSKLVQTERLGEMIAYYEIARHYEWALDELFYKHNFSQVIELEDYMEVAPDFFYYFEAAATLMEKDKTIMAVSSWNDNGQKQSAHDAGVGWMLTRFTWDELSPKWPKADWDDWLRLQENHKGRQFIQPEVCRTYYFADHGSSLGQFFGHYLEPMKLNDVQGREREQPQDHLRVPVLSLLQIIKHLVGLGIFGFSHFCAIMILGRFELENLHKEFYKRVAQPKIDSRKMVTWRLLKSRVLHLLLLAFVLLATVPLSHGDTGIAEYYEPSTDRTQYCGDDPSLFPTDKMLAFVGENLWDSKMACWREYDVWCDSPAPCKTSSGPVRFIVVGFASDIPDVDFALPQVSFEAIAYRSVDLISVKYE